MRNKFFVSVVAIILVLALSAFIGGILWTYSVNTAMELSGRPNRIETIHGTLIGLIPGFGQLSIPVAIIVYVVDKLADSDTEQPKESI